jgi:oligopeptidase B
MNRVTVPAQALLRGPGRAALYAMLAGAILAASPGLRADCGTGTPPVAAVIPYEMVEHGRVRTDDYYWLRDDERSDPKVLAYLEAENAWYRACMARLEPLVEELYRELVARVDPVDASVPVRLGNYEYYERFHPGGEHPVFARRALAPGAPEEILLDGAEAAKGSAFYDVWSWDVSEDGRYFAWSEDRTGREQFTIRIRDTATGEILPDAIPNASPSIAFANDNRTLFYISLDGALRPYRVYRHVLGTDPAEDVLVYEEKDNRFDLSLRKSRSRRYIMLELVSTLSTETRLVDADRPESGAVPFLPREPDHRYEVDPGSDGQVWILSNWEAPNYRLLRAPVDGSADKSRWVEVLPERADVFLEGLAVFRDYIAIEEVHEGNLRIRILPLQGGDGYYIPSEEPAYTMVIDDNPSTESEWVRFVHSSMATPATTWEYNMRTRERRFLRQEFAGTGFDQRELVTTRATARARDGTGIPVTLLYRRGLEPDGTHPLYLLGYGAYGSTYFPEFAQEYLSLVSRGVVVAIAHVRGGQELGRRWYEGGRRFNKKNTFTDFIDAAEWLVKAGWAAPGRVAGSGRSAGGLLIGAVANFAPETFAALVAGVPFVDVITTMMDESIPLTSMEWDEWGDPRKREDYEYMLSYSPYDQIRPQEYPHMLVTAGLWDARVQYWEPAKWVAKLRASKQGNNRLLFYTDMSAGHAGAAARFRALRETAEEYAFVLDALGAAAR